VDHWLDMALLVLLALAVVAAIVRR